MTLDELPGWALAMLDSGRVGRLAFADDRNRPRVMPVTYALVDGRVWTAIDDVKPKRGEPARVRYLRERPAAAVVVDRYSDDWSQLAWVQVLGEVAVLDPRAAPEAMDALAAKYEPYREAPPPGPLLRLDVSRALCWRAGGE